MILKISRANWDFSWIADRLNYERAIFIAEKIIARTLALPVMFNNSKTTNWFQQPHETPCIPLQLD